jgi:hypothetical protein
MVCRSFIPNHATRPSSQRERAEDGEDQPRRSAPAAPARRTSSASRCRKLASRMREARPVSRPAAPATISATSPRRSGSARRRSSARPGSTAAPPAPAAGAAAASVSRHTEREQVAQVGVGRAQADHRVRQDREEGDDPGAQQQRRGRALDVDQDQRRDRDDGRDLQHDRKREQRSLHDDRTNRPAISDPADHRQGEAPKVMRTVYHQRAPAIRSSAPACSGPDWARAGCSGACLRDARPAASQPAIAAMKTSQGSRRTMSASAQRVARAGEWAPAAAAALATPARNGLRSRLSRASLRPRAVTMLSRVSEMRPGFAAITTIRCASVTASNTLCVTNRIVRWRACAQASRSSFRRPGHLIEGGEGFIHQQHAGLRDQCARDRHAHLHAAGELARKGIFESGQAHRAQLCLDRLARLLA